MRLRIITSAAVLIAVGSFVACSDSTSPSASGTTYIATMNGANERPTPNSSTATGTATYVLTGNSLSYTITVSGLTATASGAHLHAGRADQAGPIIVPYTVSSTQSGTVTTGTIDLSFPVVCGSGCIIPGDSVKVLLNNGNGYANVHNSAFPGGEIRGQIIRQ